MENKRLHIKATEEAITVYWEKMAGEQGLRYRIYLNGTQTAETEKTHGTLEGLKERTAYELSVRAVLGTEKNGEPKEELIWESNCTAHTQKRKRRIDITQAPYLAKGDGKALNTAAIQQAIEDCKEDEMVYVPTGTFLTGALTLHDHMELYLEEGAVLQGSSNPEDYLPRIPSRFEGTERECYQSLLNLGVMDHRAGCASGNVLIRGKGTISGGGRLLAERMMAAERERLKEYIHSLGDKVLECENANTIPGRTRGRLIQLCNAKNVRITGLTLQNGPGWNVHMIYSEQIVTDHCIFRSENIWNGDGWDPDSSSDCTIFACTFYTGDDSVAIKSGKNPEGNEIGRPCSHIRIFDCTCAYGHGITMGSEMSGGIEDVAIWDCNLGNSLYGLEIKGTKKRGGFVRDISVRGCRLPRILMHSVLYNNDGEGAPVPPVFEKCLFEDMDILGRYMDKDREYQPCRAIELEGFDEEGYEIRGIVFRRIRLGCQEFQTQPEIFMKYCKEISLEDVSTISPSDSAGTI